MTTLETTIATIGLNPKLRVALRVSTRANVLQNLPTHAKSLRLLCEALVSVAKQNREPLGTPAWRTALEPVEG